MSAEELKLKSYRDLAEQRGQLLRDLTDKWTERRVEFVRAKRAMGEQLSDLKTRERVLTHRIVELERTLQIVWSCLNQPEPAETRIAVISQHVQQQLPVSPARRLPVGQTGQAGWEVTQRGGAAGAQQQ